MARFQHSVWVRPRRVRRGRVAHGLAFWTLFHGVARPGEIAAKLRRTLVLPDQLRWLKKPSLKQAGITFAELALNFWVVTGLQMPQPQHEPACAQPALPPLPRRWQGSPTRWIQAA